MPAREIYDRMYIRASLLICIAKDRISSILHATTVSTEVDFIGTTINDSISFFKISKENVFNIFNNFIVRFIAIPINTKLLLDLNSTLIEIEPH